MEDLKKEATAIYGEERIQELSDMSKEDLLKEHLGDIVDLSFVAKQYSTLLYHVTDGALSKPMTKAASVIEALNRGDFKEEEVSNE